MSGSRVRKWKNFDWLFLDDRFLLVEHVVGDDSLADVGVVFDLEVAEDDDEDDEGDDADDKTRHDADDCSQRGSLRGNCLRTHGVSSSRVLFHRLVSSSLLSNSNFT